MKVKKTALIVCNNGKEYWITQKQFWNMVREGVVEQTGDQPLQGDSYTYQRSAKPGSVEENSPLKFSSKSQNYLMLKNFLP
jgi:hypothetical protein